MNEETLRQLVKNDLYQVFLFSCPAIVFTPTRHNWFVLNKKGALSRWDVCYERNEEQKDWGFLHNNILPPTKYGPIPYNHKVLLNGRLECTCEGNEASIAKSMIEFIEKSPETYPYKRPYNLLGSNSNTYVQWVLKHFPDSELRLPWGSFGKNYPTKEFS